MLPAWMRQLRKSLSGYKVQSRSQASRRSTQLTLEQLEDRITPAEVLGSATLTVTSAQDPAALTTGTLRYAINQANQDAAAGKSDTIDFNVTQMGSNTITLIEGTLPLQSGSGTVTIDGGGQVTISGGNANPIFYLDSGAQAVLNGLSIQNGVSNYGESGGILNFGSLTVSNSTLSKNSAVGAGSSGGAIDNEGELMLSSSTISDNSARSASVGADAEGGAIYNGSKGQMTVSSSTISDNSASIGGGICNLGQMTVSSSTISGNTAAGGGGINNEGALTVSNSTIYGNSAQYGGGIQGGASSLTVSNSTITGNTANTRGGGLYCAADSGAADLLNTIVAGNVGASSSVDDVNGYVTTDSAHNLIGNGSGLLGIGFGFYGITNGDANGNQVGSSSNPINPFLGPFSNNGGATQTLALLPGSPAIGAGGAVTTLTTAITSTNTSTITVANAAAIASTPGDYVIQVDGEQMVVTNVDLSTNTLTVTRGYNGTAAEEHSAGAELFLAMDQRGQTEADPPDIGSYQSQSAVASFVVSTTHDVVAGVGFPVNITTEDKNGHTVTSYNGSVILTSSDGQVVSPILTGPGRGPGPELRPDVVTLINGVASPTITLDHADSTTLQVSSGGITESSNPITVTMPRLVVTSEPPSTVEAGRPFSVTAKVEDGFGNLVTSYTGPVSVSFLGAYDTTTPQVLKTVTATAGVAVFNGLSIQMAGSSYGLRISAGNINPVVGVTPTATNSLTVTAAAPQQLVIESQLPASIVAGTAFEVTMKVEDAFGNLVQNYNGPVSVTLPETSGHSVLQGTTTVMAQNGVATFSNLIVVRVGSGFVLHGRLNNQTTGNSNEFSVTPAAATRLAISTPPPSNMAAGSSFGLTVVAEDAFGNVATSYTGPVSLTLSGNPNNARLEGITTVMASAGVAVFSGLSIDTSGSGYVLQATGTGVSAGSVSGEISYWSGNGSANDSIGGNNGVASPGISFTSGLVGKAFGFTAAGESVRAPANNLPTGNAARTLDVWVRLDTPVPANGEVFFAGYGNFGRLNATFQLGATSQHVFFSQWGAAIFGPALQTGKWYNVAATYNGATVTLYLNGQAVGSSSNLTINTPTGSSFYIGSPNLGARQLIGAAQGVALFNRALSPPEIQLLYQTGPLTSDSPPSSSLTAIKTNRFTITPAAPQQLVIVSQPPTIITAGSSFGMALRVEDAFGNVVRDYNGPISVTLSGNGGNAVLQGITTVIAHGGMATFSSLKVDKAGSGYVLQVQLNHQTMGGSNSFSVTPAAATHLAISTPPPSNVTVDSPFGMTVAAEDVFGNVITGYNGPVTLTLAANPGGSSLSGTITVNAINGLATFSTLSLNELGNGYTLKVSSSNLTAAITSPFTVVPRLVFSQLPSSVIAGQTFSATVLVEGGEGNIVTSYSGPITLGTNSYGLFGNTSQIQNGKAVFSLEATHAATGYQLQAHAGSLTALSAPFTVLPSAATHLAILSAPPSVVTAGSPFSMTAALEDAYGNVVPYTGSANVALASDPAAISNPAATLRGTTTINVFNGEATFNNLALVVESGGYTMRATMGNFTATSSSFRVSAAAPSYVLVQNPNPRVTVGGLVQIDVVVVDIYGNAVLNWTSPVHLSFPGGNITYRGTTTESFTYDQFPITVLHVSSNSVSFVVTSGNLKPGSGILHVISSNPPPPPAPGLYNYWITVGGAIYDSNDEDVPEQTYYIPHQSADQLNEDGNSKIEEYTNALEANEQAFGADYSWYGQIMVTNVVVQRVS